MNIVFVTGASGSGKTTLIKNLEACQGVDVSCYFFDSIGVPSSEEMIRKYGTRDEWQRQTTYLWVDKILNENKNKTAVLDGQIRLAFIRDACKQSLVDDYKIILIDCSDKVRSARLKARKQSELANRDMMKWAAYLRQEAKDIGATILDTSELSVQASLHRLKELIEQ